MKGLLFSKEKIWLFCVVAFGGRLYQKIVWILQILKLVCCDNMGYVYRLTILK